MFCAQIRGVCFRGDLLHRQLVVGGPLPGATITGFQCALLCPSPFCLLWTVPHWSQCAAEPGRLYPSLWRMPELPSTLLMRGCQRTVLLRRCWWRQCFWCLIKCFPCRIMPLSSLSVSCPIRVSKGVQSTWMCLPFRHPTRGLPTRNRLFSCSSSLVRPVETSLSTASQWRT